MARRRTRLPETQAPQTESIIVRRVMGFKAKTHCRLVKKFFMFRVQGVGFRVCQSWASEGRIQPTSLDLESFAGFGD